MISWLVRRGKRAYFVLRNVRTFLRKEHELHGWPDAWSDLRLLVHGFHSDKRYLYQLGPNDLPLASYIGDFERLMLRRVNEPYAAFLDHKALFTQVFGTQFRVPVDHGLIRRGVFTPLHGSDLPVASAMAALADPALPDDYVLKRIGGGGGKDVWIVHRHNVTEVTVNGEALPLATLVEQLDQRSFLVTELLTQGDYANALFPGSINTVRVVTMRDDSGPFIAFAVQRIGTERSQPTDNLNQGGLCALVDLTNGTLGPARRLETQTRPVAYTHHPETGAPIAGQVIPHWDEVVTTLLSTMDAFPRLRYVGWDVVLQQDGFLVLEGNSYPGVQVAQLHRPLRGDPRIAGFFDTISGRSAA